MKPDHTHITVILDRSGSMKAVQDDTIGGFNAFVKQQTAQPGSATLTLVQFDSVNPYKVVHRGKPLEDVPPLTRRTFVPRGGTPLLDAMGRGINDLEQYLAGLGKSERPGRVVVVILTDGQENASREFRKDQVAAHIKEKQEKSGWQFVFLSADLAAIQDAIATGVQATSTMAFDKTAVGTTAAWMTTARSIAKYRAGRRQGVWFTEADRPSQDGGGAT